MTMTKRYHGACALLGVFEIFFENVVNQSAVDATLLVVVVLDMDQVLIIVPYQVLVQVPVMVEQVVQEDHKVQQVLVVQTQVVQVDKQDQLLKVQEKL